MSDFDAFGFDALLDILERDPRATMHIGLWQTRLGVPLVTLLRATGILWECARVDWYPCLCGFDNSCRQQIVKNPDSATHPYLGVCSHTRTGMRTALAESDLYTLSLSRDGLTRELRKVFGISGEFQPHAAPFPEVTRIGTLRGRPVFLALLEGGCPFESWLAGLGSSYVMVPTDRNLTDMAKRQCAPDRPTELIVLRQSLSATETGFVANWPLELGDGLAPGRASGVVTREPDTYLAYSDRGYEVLTAAERRERLSELSQYDLFLDTTEVAEQGRYRASKKDIDGKVESVLLPLNEAAVLVELVQASGPLESRQFRSVLVSHVEKLVERARSKIDVRLGRYHWRSIQTIRATKAYQFRPPPSMKWLVLVELRESGCRAAERTR